MAFITDTEYKKLLADSEKLNEVTSEYKGLLADSEKLKEVTADIKVVADTVKGILERFNLMDLITSEEKPTRMKVMSKVGGAVSSIMLGHEDLNLLPDDVLVIIKKYTN